MEDLKSIWSKLYFLFFTLIFLLSIYFFYFQHPFYDAFIRSIFQGDIKKEHIRLLFYSFIAFYVSYMIVYPYCKIRVYHIVNKVYDESYPERKLYDTLHAIIPYHEYSKYLREIFLALIVIGVFIYFMYNRKIEFAYSLLFLYSAIIVLRSCIFNLTLLPKSNDECSHNTFFSSCNDLLFSGHTSKMLMLLLLADYYNIMPNSMSNVFYAIFVGMIFFILSSRDHYTIDILFAIFIVFFLFYLYYGKIDLR